MVFEELWWLVLGSFLVSITSFSRGCGGLYSVLFSNFGKIPLDPIPPFLEASHSRSTPFLRDVTLKPGKIPIDPIPAPCGLVNNPV